MLHTYKYAPAACEETSSTCPSALPTRVPFLYRLMLSADGALHETFTVVDQLAVHPGDAESASADASLLIVSVLDELPAV